MKTVTTIYSTNLRTAKASPSGRLVGLLFISALIISASVQTKAQNVYIPDSNFKKVLLADTLINTNKDTAIQVSEALGYKDSIIVHSYFIYDLTGLETFTALTKLDCSIIGLNTLNLSFNTALTTLNCALNNLTTLDVSANNALTALYCGGNQLTALKLPANKTLAYLECSNNQLTSLNVSANTALTYLECGYNGLTTLNLSKNPALIKLICENNLLTSLDVSSNTVLAYLDCDDNQLTSLNISANTSLKEFACSNNQLKSLIVLGDTALSEIYCIGNQLTTLDVSSNKALTNLECSNNTLTTVDVSSNTSLTYFGCDHNQLTFLNMRNGYNDSLISFNARFNPSLKCIQVDSVAYMNKNWVGAIDSTASYNTNCVRTGIKEATNNTAVSIFPNPTNSKVTISGLSENNKNIHIANIVGETVQTATTNGATMVEINLSNLPSGLYFINVGGRSYKIVKE